ncbi:general stress protein [Sediminibacillus massiliensis]|uniref:general stress protein n=1 Tax=Sediminibacillus massiliensis TaxID=1926277 RepID=UPI0009882E9D|nr:general stress protein [Sediminibacillus massiliensis]
MKSKVIGGVFKSQDDAIRAIEELKAKGYGKDDFSVFAKDKDDVKAIGEETNTDISKDKSGRGKNAGKGLGIGAGTGGVLGGLTGLIAEIGLLAIPGVGAIAAAGPIAAALTGAGIGAGGGGIVGALVGAGIPEEHAKEYENKLKEGNIIVLVEASEHDREIYQTFLANRTENHRMYPDEVVVNERR